MIERRIATDLNELLDNMPAGTVAYQSIKPLKK
jgi:hypothetical protein